MKSKKLPNEEPEKVNSKKKLSKKKKRLLAVGLVLILMASSPFIVNAYVKSSVKDRIIPVDKAAKHDADCILVFGAGLNLDGSPSPMLADRLSRAVELYDAGASDRMLMSGDHGREEYDEVNAMKQFARDYDIPSENIFMDHAGFSTYESLYRAKEGFKAKKVILVTQEYHLYRALYVARSLGLDAYGVSSDLQSYSGQAYYNAREVMARCKDFATSLFKPKPTYLGEAIPVDGNGDLTNDSNTNTNLNYKSR
ncbi:MAG: ElyC/SanA/YdcF family protein [Oscillospiraceae bacterium]|nr:ElyC/SanA/YdcF family protein [Oscillospiraceae bacterium]